MSKDYSNLYLSAVKHDTLTNKRKINDLEPLWFHYSHLLNYFIKDMNLNFIKGNGIPKFTNAKPYQDDITTLYNRATKRYHKKLDIEEEVHESLESILQDIADNAIQTPLSARYVQCCYSQAYETYTSWAALLSNKIKEYLGSSSVTDELVDGQPLLTTCYRINKYQLWYQKPVLRWAYGDNGELVVPTKKNKAQIELIVPDVIMKFMRRLVKQARKSMSLPDLSKVRVLKLDEKVATLEVTKNAHHVNYWLKLSTLDKRKPVYIPLKNNTYYAKLLETGERLPFVQVGLKENKLTVSPILAHRKAEIREDSNELGLDFGIITMFTTSTGERHGITTFTKLKIWDDLLLTRTKELQAKKIKLSSDPYYKSLQSRIRSFMKNEIGRIFNKLANKGYGIFVVEKLDFRYSNLSKRMNRLLNRTYRKVIKDKLVRLEEKCGITAVEVNPAFTSQECSNCGFVSKENRKSQSAFKCTCCNYSINADVNAARNIIKRRSFDNELRAYAREHKVRITRCLILEKLLQKYYHEKQLSSELSFIGCQP
jgi:hypothetical protein